MGKWMMAMLAAMLISGGALAGQQLVKELAYEPGGEPMVIKYIADVMESDALNQA